MFHWYCKQYKEAAKFISKVALKAGLKVRAITLAAELSWYAMWFHEIKDKG